MGLHTVSLDGFDEVADILQLYKQKSHIRVEANYGHVKTGNKTPDRGVWGKIPYQIHS